MAGTTRTKAKRARKPKAAAAAAAAPVQRLTTARRVAKERGIELEAIPYKARQDSAGGGGTTHG